MYDFHTHTTFSDGELIPTELVRRMAAAGYKEMAITDHADYSNIENIITSQKKIKKSASLYGIKLYTGAEITHVPPEEIDDIAKYAKTLGAEIVIVHGETVSEPVAVGTNHAAVLSDYVDILAHPGLISDEDAKLAAKNGIYLELTSRRGHNKTNGHVASTARRFNTGLVIQSDTHSPEDIMSENMRYLVARGAGLTEDEAKKSLNLTADEILRK
ncbi:MAG: histidinol phosphate phosphatase domain-containing protein [Methanocorpusculum sp.]|nr:histidinol phosphate phosphatase domain-containing protein [Methanocorpusculum sp.]